MSVKYMSDWNRFHQIKILANVWQIQSDRNRFNLRNLSKCLSNTCLIQIDSIRLKSGQMSVKHISAVAILLLVYVVLLGDASQKKRECRRHSCLLRRRRKILLLLLRRNEWPQVRTWIEELRKTPAGSKCILLATKARPNMRPIYHWVATQMQSHFHHTTLNRSISSCDYHNTSIDSICLKKGLSLV